MITTYLAGLLLGFGLIIPIGAQNVFVFSQGLSLGIPRSLWTVVAAGACDTLLIIIGAVGASALINSVPGLRPTLLAAGALFLLYLAIGALRAKITDDGMTTTAVTSIGGTVTKTASVSLLNPHAILDTVVVMGAAIAAQRSADKFAFATGAVSASWVWFFVLAAAAASMRRFLNPGRRIWFDRISGLIMLIFAGFLAFEFFHALS